MTWLTFSPFLLSGSCRTMKMVVIATNQGEPLVGNNTLAGQAYQSICLRVLAREVTISWIWNIRSPCGQGLPEYFHTDVRRGGYACDYLN